MAQTHEGAMKVLAAKAGESLESFLDKVSAGQKWCMNCRIWHPTSVFGFDSTRYDGLVPGCRESRNRAVRGRYAKVETRKSTKGIRFVAPRDGDKRQARERVNCLVNSGLIPNPNLLPCLKCGDLAGNKRHEYHHHLGYSIENQENVIPLCTKCHRIASIENGEWRAHQGPRTNLKQFCDKGHALKRDRDGGWRCHECRLGYWKRYNKEKRAHGNTA